VSNVIDCLGFVVWRLLIKAFYFDMRCTGTYMPSCQRHVIRTTMPVACSRPTLTLYTQLISFAATSIIISVHLAIDQTGDA